MPIPQSFLADFQRVQSGQLSYMVYSYDKSFYLSLSDKSDAFDEDEFKDCFNTSKGSHAILAIQLNDLRKTVLINWLGDSAPPQLKGRFAGLCSEIDALITCHVVHNARSEGDINYHLFESLVTRASGSKYGSVQPAAIAKSQTPILPQRNPPIIPSQKPSIAPKSTTAQMIYAQKKESSDRQQSPSPPPAKPTSPTLPDHRLEIQQLRNQSLQAAAKWNPPKEEKPTESELRKLEIQQLKQLKAQPPQPMPLEEKKLSDSELRQLELQEIRRNPSSTAIEYESEQQSLRLSEPELRRQEFEAITSTSSLKAKFQQLALNGQVPLQPSPHSSSLNDLSQTQQPVLPTRVQPQPPKRDSSPISATALYDYEASEDNEISFKQGDSITNIHKLDKDWWQGQVRGQVGLFPNNYVALLEQKPAAPVNAVALYDYTAQEGNELSFKMGDLINNIDKIDEGWWKGELHQTSGLFPSAYGISSLLI